MSNFSPFTFLHITDHHIGTPRSYRFSPVVNKRWAAIKRQISEVNADLLLVGGDIARDGDTHEAEYQLSREDMETLPFPFFVVPGNMDVGNNHSDRDGASKSRDDTKLNMTSSRLQLFGSYFGPVNWTFVHKEVRFTGFYAAVAGSGLPEEDRFWRFMERLPTLPAAKYHVAVMHYWLYINSPDEPTWDITQQDQYLPWYFSIDQPHRARILDILKASGLNILFCGHVHTGRPVEVVDGIRIYKTPGAGSGAQLQNMWDEVETREGFQLCHVTEKGIEVSFVPGADQCEKAEGGFGPGGHPRIAERDYSLAREEPRLAPDPWLMQ